MNNKTFKIGGSIEKALKGDIELRSLDVLQEAWRITAKNYFTFVPAVIGLFLAQVALLLVGLHVQLGSASVFFDAVVNGGEIPVNVIDAGYMANFWADVLSAPLYAGVSMMALNHAVGLPSKPTQLVKGFSFTLVSIITVLLASSIQGIASNLLPPIGLFLTMAFSMAIILVCEKRISPLKAIQFSLLATIRKLLPFTAIFVVILTMFIVSFATAGLGLIWTIPFFFNVKAIIYRNLFGITLQVTNVKKGHDDDAPDEQEDPKVFNA